MHSILMPSLQSKAVRVALEKDIHTFYSTAKPLINHPKPMTSYVMDLAWVTHASASGSDDKSTQKILLVEVNPFDGFYGTMSGSTGLFSWQSDRLLLTGKQPKPKASDTKSAAGDDKTTPKSATGDDKTTSSSYPEFVLRLREEALPEAEVRRRTRPEWWSLMNTLS